MEGKPDRGFFTLQWHVTHRCNLRCAHCYQEDFSAMESDEHVDVVLGQYKELLEQVDMRGCLNVTGGEPLLYRGLFRLLDQARDMGLKTAVLTNGTLIGKREAKRLKACSVDYVQVSLDGTRKTHDAIRGQGAFERAMQGIRWLRSEGIFTTVSFTAQRTNVKDFPQLARLCRDAGVDKLWFDRVVIPAGEDHASLSLSAKQSEKLFRKAARVSCSTPAVCIRALQFQACEGAPIYRCTAAERLLAVLANGDVMACRRLPIVLGNVHERSLASLYFDSPDAVAVRESGVPAACSSCEHASSCAGGAKCIAYARTGSFAAPDPDCPLILA